MSDQSQRTEEPTQRKKDKARKQGQFPTARQFVTAIQFCVLVTLLENYSGAWLDTLVRTSRGAIRSAFTVELTAPAVLRMTREWSLALAMPLFMAGAALVGSTIAAQMLVTRFGFATGKLAPDFTRLNPMSHLKHLFQENFPNLIQAIALLVAFSAAVYALGTAELDHFARLPLQSLDSGVSNVLRIILSLLWKVAFLFVGLGCLDLFRQLRSHNRGLRMSKLEIRDEAKESEGDPHIKARLRSLRRNLTRRKMMQAVPTATAVVVNPTHFAVALRYEPATMAAPIVVAKGKNYLALRIRQKATEHLIPIIENPPLAQGLYKSVEVGQEIPPQLYRVVAEVLAYIFRLKNRR